ncbi:MAG: hypothetical protein ACRDRT_11275, partial [Pseudonocardiaceae bacterium]
TQLIDPSSYRSHGSSREPSPVAGMTGTGMTITQLRVPDKTNEITCFASSAGAYDLTGCCCVSGMRARLACGAA